MVGEAFLNLFTRIFIHNFIYLILSRHNGYYELEITASIAGLNYKDKTPPEIRVLSCKTSKFDDCI